LAAARAFFLALAMSVAGGALGGELVLAPGASVTILDAADPSVRIVMTAPLNGTLDLSELLSLKPEESVRSIVTRFQANYAGALARNADGSLTLAPAPTQARQPTAGLAGGVLIRNGEQWQLRPGTTPLPAVSTAAPKPAAAPPPGQRTIFKAGVTREQAEDDIGQCRQLSDKAVTSLMSPAERTSTYNAAMFSCLRSFGYEIRG
jgi:hypothetical protein